jgi:hypothetical protein
MNVPIGVLEAVFRYIPRAAVALGLVGYTVIGIVLAVISMATAAALRAVMPGS